MDIGTLRRWFPTDLIGDLPVDLADAARLASNASVSVAITACVYLSTRTLLVAFAVFGPQKLGDHALNVLRLLCHAHDAG